MSQKQPHISTRVVSTPRTLTVSLTSDGLGKSPTLTGRQPLRESKLCLLTARDAGCNHTLSAGSSVKRPLGAHRARAPLLDTEPGQALATGDTHQQHEGSCVQAAETEGAGRGARTQPAATPRLPPGDVLVQASVSNSVTEVFPRPRGWVPAPPDTLANCRSPVTILSLTDRRERQWEKNPAGLLGAPLMTLQLENQLSCMGWGAAGIQAGRSVKAIPKERAASEPRSWQRHRPGGSRALSEERHGLAEKISLTREGRMWQGEPGSSTRVNCVSRRPRDQPGGPSYLRPDAVSALRDVSTFQLLFVGIFVSRVSSIQMRRFSRPCH